MTRLIDADALLSNVETRRKYLGTFGEEDYGAVCYGMQHVEELINSAPTVRGDNPFQWISIDEKLPEEGISVLVTDGKTIQVNSYDNSYKQFGYWNGNGDEDDWKWIKNANKLSNWMELPKPSTK